MADAARTLTKAARSRRRARRRKREDREYLEWIQSLPSLASGKMPCSGHHEPPKQMGGGADWYDRKTIPLTAEEHTERHSMSKEEFEALYCLDIDRAIQDYNDVYDQTFTKRGNERADESQP